MTQMEPAAASMAIHLPSSTPKGGKSMVSTPIMAMSAVRGMRSYRPRMSSMSRLPISCSMVPTQRKSRDLDTAWKMISMMAAVMARGVFRPAQAMIRPRLEMVE